MLLSPFTKGQSVGHHSTSPFGTPDTPALFCFNYLMNLRISSRYFNKKIFFIYLLLTVLVKLPSLSCLSYYAISLLWCPSWRSEKFRHIYLQFAKIISYLLFNYINVFKCILGDSTAQTFNYLGNDSQKDWTELTHFSPMFLKLLKRGVSKWS